MLGRLRPVHDCHGGRVRPRVPAARTAIERRLEAFPGGMPGTSGAPPVRGIHADLLLLQFRHVRLHLLLVLRASGDQGTQPHSLLHLLRLHGRKSDAPEPPQRSPGALHRTSTPDRPGPDNLGDGCSDRGRERSSPRGGPDPPVHRFRSRHGRSGLRLRQLQCACARRGASCRRNRERVAGRGSGAGQRECGSTGEFGRRPQRRAHGGRHGHWRRGGVVRLSARRSNTRHLPG